MQLYGKLLYIAQGGSSGDGALVNTKEKKSSQVSPGPPFCAGPSPYDGVSSLPEKVCLPSISSSPGGKERENKHISCHYDSIKMVPSYFNYTMQPASLSS